MSNAYLWRGGGVPCSRPARRSPQPRGTLALCQPNHRPSVRTFQHCNISRFQITINSTHHNDDNENQSSKTHSWNKALSLILFQGLGKADDRYYNHFPRKGGPSFDTFSNTSDWSVRVTKYRPFRSVASNPSTTNPGFHR